MNLSVSSERMIKIITGQFCSRCHMIAPMLKKYAEKSWLDYIEKDINEASPEEIEWATQLPVIYFWEDRVEYDDALAKIM